MKSFNFIIASLVLIFACSSPSSKLESQRSVSSDQIDDLDPKFENYFHSNEAEEKRAIQDVGRVIGSFVKNEAGINQSWVREYSSLKNKSQQEGLSPYEKRRMNALGIVVNDLPQRAGYATRDVHRKPHGCFAAQVKMNADIPADLQHGFFIPGKSYDAIVRYSNGNPKNQHDFSPDARGMAVKLLDWGTLPRRSNSKVPVYLYSSGETSIDAADINRRTLLDMLAINFPTFFVNDPAVYAKVNRAFLVTSDDPQNWISHKLGEGVSVFLEGMDSWQRELALNVNGSLITSPLSESYWSMMAFRLGRFSDPGRTAIKFKFLPCSQNLPPGGNPGWTKNHTFANPTHLFWSDTIPSDTINQLKKPENRYYLRKAAFAELSEENIRQDGQPIKCFDIQVQRFIDQDNTPIEDTTSIWLESKEQQKIWAQKFSDNGRGELSEVERARRYDMIMGRAISPFITIGRLSFYPVSKIENDAVQTGLSSNELACDNLSFNPWNNVVSEHKPLGIVGRMRRAAYSASRSMRHSINKVH